MIIKNKLDNNIINYPCQDLIIPEKHTFHFILFYSMVISQKKGDSDFVSTGIHGLEFSCLLVSLWFI